MTRITIRGRKWTIDEVPDVVAAVGKHANRRDRARGLDKICMFDTARILVCQSLEAPSKLEVYVHELIHACNPDLRENTVAFTARVIADALDKALHYTFTPPTPATHPPAPDSTDRSSPVGHGESPRPQSLEQPGRRRSPTATAHADANGPLTAPEGPNRECC